MNFDSVFNRSKVCRLTIQQLEVEFIVYYFHRQRMLGAVRTFCLFSPANPVTTTLSHSRTTRLTKIFQVNPAQLPWTIGFSIMWIRFYERITKICWRPRRLYSFCICWVLIRPATCTSLTLCKFCVTCENLESLTIICLRIDFLVKILLPLIKA